MDKTIISFRVNDEIFSSVKEWAFSENRTVSNFMENILYEEYNRRNGESITIKAIDQKINQLFDILNKEKKNQQKKEKKNTQINIDIPEYINGSIWNDFISYRSELKKPLKEKGITYLLNELSIAHKNGWDVNDLLAEAMAKGWQGAVFEKHKTARGDGQEPVKPMNTQEYLKAKEEIQQRLLCHAGISGSNRGRFADPVLIEVLINQLLGEDLSTAYATLDGLITDFYKKGTTIEENNARIQEMLK